MLDRPTQKHLGHLLKALYGTLYVREGSVAGPAESDEIRRLVAKLKTKDTRAA